MMWVYGICEDPGRPLPDGPGLEEAPLAGVEAAGLLAVVSSHERTPADASAEALWTHERVVEALMAERAVLPMRFGTALPGAQEVRDAVAVRHEELAAALDRVRGRVELGLRVHAEGEAGAAPPATTGRDYLLGRLADDAHARRLAAELHDPLSGLAVAARRQAPTGPGEVLRASYLVDAGEVPRFRGTVDDLQRGHPGLGLLCTGPWPPYSFAVGA